MVECPQLSQATQKTGNVEDSQADESYITFVAHQQWLPEASLLPLCPLCMSVCFFKFKIK